MFLSNNTPINCGEHHRHRFCLNVVACRILYNFYAAQILNGFRLLFVLLILFMFVINTTAIQEDEDYGSSIEDANEGRMGAAIHGVALNNLTQNDETTDASVEKDIDEENPSEIQKAVCTVTAGEVKASAEAVTTKTLKGVCGSSEMHAALEKLEIKFMEELKEIKTLLQQQLNNIPQVVRGETKEPKQPGGVQQSTVTEMPVKFQPMPKKFKPAVTDVHPEHSEANKNSITKSISDFYVRQSSGITPKLKSLPRQSHSSGVREQEVSKFNNTMLSDRDLKVFTYYWKLENISERITNDDSNSNTVESPIFSIKGKTLHIKAFFNHLHRDFLYLQLEYATLNQNSNHNSIMLDTGGLFKEILNDKVLFKHKISILDQNNQRSNDLVSQEFNNLEMGFSIPNSALLASPYVKKNSLLIQVFLYL